MRLLTFLTVQHPSLSHLVTSRPRHSLNSVWPLGSLHNDRFQPVLQQKNHTSFESFNIPITHLQSFISLFPLFPHDAVKPLPKQMWSSNNIIVIIVAIVADNHKITLTLDPGGPGGPIGPPNPSCPIGPRRPFSPCLPGGPGGPCGQTLN